MSDIGHKSRECGNYTPPAKRGRPKKKPDYDVEQNINSLLETAVSLFEVPYDDRVERPEGAPTITHVAEEMNTSRMRVRKLLITAGYYSTDTSRRIQKLYEQGLSIQEIGERLDLGRSAVHNMLPYKKGIYKLPDPTLNAEQCQQFQTRKKACENLHEHLDEDCCDRYLWEAIQTFAGFNFRTPDKCRITYSVDCETICFGDLRLTRKEITDAFRKARKTQREKGCVCSPDGLCCRGARELYTVFLRIGACCKSVSEI